MESQEIGPSGNQTVILPATWHDYHAVRRLEKICFPRDSWPFWDVFGVLALPNVVRLKAIYAGKIVGFIAVDVRNQEETAWIATIGVLPEYRRRGIATALIQTSEGRVTVPVIRLSVRASNRAAQQLYQCLGYREVERWRRYYQGGEEAIVMQKELGRG